MNEIGDGERTADPAHRRERGIEAYARIFDVPEKDVPTAMAGRVGPVFAEEVFLAAGGPAWFHPALTDRERSMVVIAALAAQGVAGERLDSHVRLAQRDGLGYEVLTAMMTLVTKYIGQAAGRKPWKLSSVSRAWGSRRHRQAPGHTSSAGHSREAASATAGRNALLPADPAPFVRLELHRAMPMSAAVLDSEVTL
jgi:alkylhydroperoxidase/carboxymuconolactone decarboxylase family protein YurZ